MKRFYQEFIKGILLTSLLVVVFLFPDVTYATEDSTMKDVFEVVDTILKFLAWFWVVPATIAGELLSNDLVFGGKFNLEIYLWRIWVIMRNFANFFIGGIFLYYIFAHMYKSIGGASVSDFMGKIGRLFLAAILVNMSFFLIRAVVDISIVATAAVSSLPHTIIEKRREGLSGQIQVKKKYCVDVGGVNSASTNCDQEENKIVSLDSILPQADNMGGPILFMGVAMLDLLAADAVPLSIKNRENLALVTALKIIIIIIFTAPILALMVVNMMRIFYIRLWTIFSPFIVLDLVLGREKSPLRGSDGKGGLAYNGLGDIIGLIFVPVVVVGTLAIGFILMLGLTSVIRGGAQYSDRSVSSIQITGEPATIGIPHVVNVGVDGSLFKRSTFRTLGFFGEALMAFFCMTILWGMVKVGFSFSSIASKYSTKIFDTVGSAAKAIPIVPIAGGLSMKSIENAGGPTGLAKKLSGLEEMEAMSGHKARKRADDLKKKFGLISGNYDDTIHLDDLTAMRLGSGLEANIGSIKKALDGKNNIKYTGNVKEAFEKKLRFSDLKENYFKKLNPEDMSALVKTQGRYNFVDDVVNNRTLTKNASKYNETPNSKIGTATFKKSS